MTHETPNDANEHQPDLVAILESIEVSCEATARTLQSIADHLSSIRDAQIRMAESLSLCASCVIRTQPTKE